MDDNNFTISTNNTVVPNLPILVYSVTLSLALFYSVRISNSQNGMLDNFHFLLIHSKLCHTVNSWKFDFRQKTVRWKIVDFLIPIQDWRKAVRNPKNHSS